LGSVTVPPIQNVGPTESTCAAPFVGRTIVHVWYTASCTGDDEPEIDPISNHPGSAQDITVGWDHAHLENRVYVRRSSFRSSPSTYLCIVGWNRDAGLFEDDCLFIPSVELADIASVEGEWMTLELVPGSMRHRRTDRYRVSLLSLGQRVESLLA